MIFRSGRAQISISVQTQREKRNTCYNVAFRCSVLRVNSPKRSFSTYSVRCNSREARDVCCTILRKKKKIGNPCRRTCITTITTDFRATTKWFSYYRTQHRFTRQTHILLCTVAVLGAVYTSIETCVDFFFLLSVYYTYGTGFNTYDRDRSVSGEKSNCADPSLSMSAGSFVFFFCSLFVASVNVTTLRIEGAGSCGEPPPPRIGTGR